MTRGRSRASGAAIASMTWRRPFRGSSVPTARTKRSGRPRAAARRSWSAGSSRSSLGAPGTTWMRSPRSNRPASSPATAWLGTTTASANRSARLAIARCHATPRAVRVSGCVHGTTSWIVATTGRGERVGLRTPSGASRLIPCTGPRPPGLGGRPRSHARARMRRSTGSALRVARGRERPPPPTAGGCARPPRRSRAPPTRRGPRRRARGASSRVYRPIPPGTGASSWSRITLRAVTGLPRRSSCAQYPGAYGVGERVAPRPHLRRVPLRPSRRGRAPSRRGAAPADERGAVGRRDALGVEAGLLRAPPARTRTTSLHRRSCRGRCPAGASASSERDDLRREVGGPGGLAELVVDDRPRLARAGEGEHRLREVRTVRAVEPRGAHDVGPLGVVLEHRAPHRPPSCGRTPRAVRAASPPRTGVVARPSNT